MKTRGRRLSKLTCNIYERGRTMIIYLTTNLINFKYYVGISCHDNNINYLGSGKYIKLAIREYGEQNFKKEILEKFDEDDETLGNLEDRERYWIHFYDATNSELGYNVSEYGNVIGIQWTKETRNSHSIRMKQAYQSIEAIINNRDAQILFWNTPNGKELRKNISDQNKMLFTDPEYREKHSNATKNGMAQPGIKENISYRMKNIWQRPGYKEKMWTSFKQRPLPTTESNIKRSATVNAYWNIAENRKNQSIKTSGKNNGMFNKKHNIETREKIRIKALQCGKRKREEKLFNILYNWLMINKYRFEPE
jgi:hypothetical protein